MGLMIPARKGPPELADCWNVSRATSDILSGAPAPAVSERSIKKSFVELVERANMQKPQMPNGSLL
jgi:hypothetical protein